MDDFLRLVEQNTTLRRVASKDGGEYVGACPFCGGTDRFHVWPDHPDGPRWRCMGASAGRNGCGRGGDHLAYRVERGDLTPQEAGKLRRADGGTVRLSMTARPRREMTKPAPIAQAVEPPPDVWREQARAFVDYCAGALFSDAGRDGLDWLHARGLNDDTIKALRLGWHSRDRWRDPAKWGLNGGKKVWLAAGIVIPWTVGGDVWHVKVRRFADDPPKYIRVRDGQPALYGLDFITGKRVVVICEGELDAALLWQESGDLVDVVAIGTKGQKVALPYLARLACAGRWLVALDNDADDKAQEWGDFSPRVRRVRPLQGNDLTEFAQAGGDLRGWVCYHLDRLDSETCPQDVATPAPDFFAQADALLARCDNSPRLARSWADLAQRAGWPCWGFPSWASWAADVARC